MNQTEQNLPKEDDLKLQEYRKFVYRMECTNTSDLKTRLDHAITGLVTEAGELAGLMKKLKFYEGVKIPRINFLDELADNFHYLVMAMNALDITLEDLIRLNKVKLKARHPSGFTAQTAVNKDKEKEQEEINKIIGEENNKQM